VVLLTAGYVIIRRDEGWRFSKGAYVFVGLGLTLLLGAISAVIATINPWMVRKYVLLSHENAYCILYYY